MAQMSLFTKHQVIAEPVTTYPDLPIYRVALVREAALEIARPQLSSSQDGYDILRTYLADADREHFVILMLDRKNKLIGINTVSIGSVTAAIVAPREVFKPAILSNATAIVCGHNHPSGDPQPSHEDRNLTAQLHQAGKLLDIPMLDHLIIGEHTYFSFADQQAL